MISMTWPQYQRRECRVIVKLSPQEAELLAALLMRQPAPLTIGDLIEAVYPDDEPENAECRIYQVIQGVRAKVGPEHLVSSPQGYRVVQA